MRPTAIQCSAVHTYTAATFINQVVVTVAQQQPAVNKLQPYGLREELRTCTYTYTLTYINSKMYVCIRYYNKS